MCRLRHDRSGDLCAGEKSAQCPAGPKGRGGESSTGKLLGVVAVVYVLPVVFFLLGYFLSVGLAESVRYVIAIAAAALALIPIVLYDRYAKRHEILTYTILRLF